MNTLRRCRHGLACLALVSCHTLSAQDVCRVAGWNLLGFDPVPEWRISNLARGIIAIDADVIGVVEVNPPSMLSDLCASLAAKGHDYDYVIIEQPARQNIGVLFKPHVRIADPQLVPGTDLGTPADFRSAFACRAKVHEFDFWLIAIHLKSSRGRRFRDLRNRQASAINRFIEHKRREGTEQDVLVIGDYNMISPEDDENFEALNANDWLHYASLDLPEGSYSHISQSGEPGHLLDGYAISEEDSSDSEYVSNSIRVVELPDALRMTLLQYSRRVSDHLPLRAEFRADVDNDPDEFRWGPLLAGRRPPASSNPFNKATPAGSATDEIRQTHSARDQPCETSTACTRPCRRLGAFRQLRRRCRR